MTEQGTGFASGGCRDSKNVVSKDLDWSVQLAISYKLSPFRAELLTFSLSVVSGQLLIRELHKKMNCLQQRFAIQWYLARPCIIRGPDLY